MADSDDFARAMNRGEITGALATSVTGSAADATLLRHLVRNHATGGERTITGSLVTSLNTLMGSSWTAAQWQDGFRRNRLPL